MTDEQQEVWLIFAFLVVVALSCFLVLVKHELSKMGEKLGEIKEALERRTLPESLDNSEKGKSNGEAK
ncbi:hypothetical protein CMI37_16245 [Candidatus Pacearchaeota archaeon]|nr:hypothetical protein [Candidatus Pacearchaeota archaeon]|tara:strand:+ start:1197 stop:1400 length:204 start_codon:yes stop_codon:yes gene_type:complete